MRRRSGGSDHSGGGRSNGCRLGCMRRRGKNAGLRDRRGRRMAHGDGVAAEWRAGGRQADGRGMEGWKLKELRTCHTQQGAGGAEGRHEAPSRLGRAAFPLRMTVIDRQSALRPPPRRPPAAGLSSDRRHSEGAESSRAHAHGSSSRHWVRHGCAPLAFPHNCTIASASTRQLSSSSRGRWSHCNGMRCRKRGGKNWSAAPRIVRGAHS
jgi:hypothetical protein